MDSVKLLGIGCHSTKHGVKCQGSCVGCKLALWWTERNCACLQGLRTGAFQKLWNCSLHFLCDIAVLILSLLDIIRNLSPNKMGLPMVYSKARKRQQHFLNSHSSISVCTYFAIFGQSLAKNALNQSLARTTGQLTHCRHVMSRSKASQLTHLHGDILKLQEKNPQGWSIANPDKFRLNLTTVVCYRQTEIQTIRLSQERWHFCMFIAPRWSEARVIRRIQCIWSYLVPWVVGPDSCWALHLNGHSLRIHRLMKALHKLHIMLRFSNFTVWVHSCCWWLMMQP